MLTRTEHQLYLSEFSRVVANLDNCEADHHLLFVFTLVEGIDGDDLGALWQVCERNLVHSRVQKTAIILHILQRVYLKMVHTTGLLNKLSNDTTFQY